jgi:hypothetical protein
MKKQKSSNWTLFGMIAITASLSGCAKEVASDVDTPDGALNGEIAAEAQTDAIPAELAATEGAPKGDEVLAQHEGPVEPVVEAPIEPVAVTPIAQKDSNTESAAPAALPSDLNASTEIPALTETPVETKPVRHASSRKHKKSVSTLAPAPAAAAEIAEVRQPKRRRTRTQPEAPAQPEIAVEQESSPFAAQPAQSVPANEPVAAAENSAPPAMPAQPAAALDHAADPAVAVRGTASTPVATTPLSEESSAFKKMAIAGVSLAAVAGLVMWTRRRRSDL